MLLSFSLFSPCVLAGSTGAFTTFLRIACFAFAFTFSTHYFLPLFLLEMAAALDLASALDDAPQACKDNSNLVGSPLGLRSGPGLPAARAR